MSDSKQTKSTKSKSRKNPVKSNPSTSSGNVIHNNYSISSTNISYQVSGLQLGMPTSSIIGKIDLENLKQATFRNIRTSLGSPTARDDCINYALEMVISNLIVNGRLDPAKAQNMRTPLMKAQIASICDKMLTNRKKPKRVTSPNKSVAGSSSGIKKTKSGAPTKPKNAASGQKWALQTAALPITIVTDQPPNLSSQGFIATNQSTKMITKKNSAGSCKSQGTTSAENLKKKSKRKKAKASESPARKQQSHQSQAQNTQLTQAESSLIEFAPSNQVLSESSGTSRSSYQASSEVPSYHSMEYGSSGTENEKNSALVGSHSGGKPDKTVQFDGSVLAKLEAEDKQLTGDHTGEDENSNVQQTTPEKEKDKESACLPFSSGATPASPAPQSAESRCQSAGAESSPSSTKTLNALMSSSSSIGNSHSNGFQILVDMKGFNNEEISMEVEDRKLIFLASRPKRNGLNIRKVTEIVDVPAGVNMENLKIGRQTDGFVVVEEFEVDPDT